MLSKARKDELKENDMIGGGIIGLIVVASAGASPFGAILYAIAGAKVGKKISVKK